MLALKQRSAATNGTRPSREQAALVDRLQWQLAELRASLNKIAVANAAMAAESRGQSLL
jgi:hypothetical protein